jgi:phosphatidylserine decarboxylase
MKFHKEGYASLTLVLVFAIVFTSAIQYIFPGNHYLHVFSYAVGTFFVIVILQFFRHPKRNIVQNPNRIIAPADGKVVVIEEVEETEYFKDKRLQVSIFMSPINVHVNRYPIGGEVTYVKYHPGLYLVAWHPKSSTDNERTSIVVKKDEKFSLMMKQIAGALARRIVYYCKEGDKAEQGGEMGFIKFGSRVDLLLPLGTKIEVTLNQTVTGGETVIATIN